MGESIVDRIRETAKIKGLTLKEVGIKSGVGENAIYRWSDKKPNLETLMKVADLLEVSLDYLAYGNSVSERY